MKEGGKVHTPPALFTYVAQKAPPSVRRWVRSRSTSVRVSRRRTMGRHDARLAAFDLRRADVTATGVRVAPTNVIVMSVKYYGGVGVGDRTPRWSVRPGRDLLGRASAEG